jgi:hypothetical protein
MSELRINQIDDSDNNINIEDLFEYIETLEGTLVSTEYSLTEARKQNAALVRSIAAYKANTTRRRQAAGRANVG